MPSPKNKPPGSSCEDNGGYCYHQQLPPTFRRQGFFNVIRDHEGRFGADGEEIAIHLPGIGRAVGRINRQANQNGTPRIMGGVPLRDWIAENIRIGGVMRVRIRDKHTIFITAF